MDKTLNIPQGVLASQNLRMLVEEGIIIAPDLEADSIQPASMDLRIGDRAWRVPSAFFADKVLERLVEEERSYYSIDLTRQTFLESGKTYVVELQERLALPPHIRGQVNPKSTTGRADIFVRLITDGGKVFDRIAPGYNGPMYAIVTSQSFNVKIYRGLSLNQLRLKIHNPSQLSTQELLEMGKTFDILYSRDGKPLPIRDYVRDGGLHLSLDLSGDIVGYTSKTHAPVLDMAGVGKHDIQSFWDPIPRPQNGRLILDQDKFYILMSKELVRIPNIYSAEVVDFDSGIGEFRTHYAGFFDPGFGYGEHGEIKGSTAVFEARVRDVHMEVRDGQTFCNIVFERMSMVPDRSYGAQSNYQGQTTPKLAKQFK